ncbi:hypothetical protein ACROYT_G030133 [Oculina patagonica]
MNEHTNKTVVYNHSVDTNTTPRFTKRRSLENHFGRLPDSSVVKKNYDAETETGFIVTIQNTLNKIHMQNDVDISPKHRDCPCYIPVTCRDS